MATTWKKLAMDVHKKKWTIETKTDNYTVVLGDLEKCVILNSSSDKTFTLPDTSASYIGRRIRCATIGSGRLTIEPYSGGTINGLYKLSSITPYSFVELVLMASNTWRIYSVEGHQEYDLYGGWVLSYMSGYRFCKIITIDNTKVSGSINLTDFPILINEIDRDYLKNIGNNGEISNKNGYDIIFTSDLQGTTQLNHEIQYYNGLTGSLVAWVRIPILKYNEDTVIYMHYGNTSIITSQENVDGTWEANFKGVWHLKESGNGVVNEFKDSSGNSNHGRGGDGIIADVPKQTKGKIGRCQYFDTLEDRISIAAHSSINIPSYSNWTFSAWVDPNTYGTSWPTVFCYGTFDCSIGLTVSEADPDGTIEHWVNNSTASRSNTPVTLVSGWNHIAIVRTPTTVYFYLNGVADGSAAAVPITSNNQPCMIGTGFGYLSTASFQGWIDEVHFVGTNRSADWLKTEVNNQSSPSTFYTIV